MIIRIDNNKQIKNIERFLFFYRSFLFKFIYFEIDSNMDKSNIGDFSEIINALNIKKRKARISYIYERACFFADCFFENRNLCEFIDGKCLSYRIGNRDEINGCCRMCQYKTGGVCPTKNLACKLFYCTSVKKKNDTLSFDDIRILKVLTAGQRFILKSDYFSLKKDVILDVYYGPFIAPFRITYRFISIFIKNKIKKNEFF